MKKCLVSLMPIYVLVLSLLISLGFLGSNAVSVISENAPIKNRKCVVIDAGHGGVDGGATSCTGVLESKINLDISLRLDDLMHLLGIHTVMIRKTDTSIHTEGDTIAAKKISDLKERARIVNETEDALLLSIHQNYFTDNRYSGAQVFYCDNKDSREFAEKLQHDLIQNLNKKSMRMAKKSRGVYLMEHIDCTGVLVECGFLSNLQEERSLRDPEYQKKLCCVIATATSKYLFQNTSS